MMFFCEDFKIDFGIVFINIFVVCFFFEFGLCVNGIINCLLIYCIDFCL